MLFDFFQRGNRLKIWLRSHIAHDRLLVALFDTRRRRLPLKIDIVVSQENLRAFILLLLGFGLFRLRRYCLNDYTRPVLLIFRATRVATMRPFWLKHCEVVIEGGAPAYWVEVKRALLLEVKLDVLLELVVVDE
mmetsp:Transcript_23738/g.29505  ORF Transcript_23738/g.29505 Transcript_23738/m.29505 type:complete len:134 (-) Transcript_23738:996-1397(-)